MTASIIHVSKNLFQLTSVFLAQVDYTTEGKAPGPIFWICWSAFVVLMIAALWKIFSKAGQPGWAAIIPIVNTYFVCKVAGRPGCVPVVLLYTIRRAFSFAAACGAFVWIAADARHELGEQTRCARSCVQRRGDATRDRLFS